MPTHGHLVAGRYQLGEVLGRGGVAEVRRARDTLLGRDVAIKLFDSDCDMMDKRRFESEARTLAGLRHPGLVSVYDADPAGQSPFIVLELIDGPTLRERVNCGPMREQDVRRVGVALAEALAHVHAHGVIHRDIKPSNVLLDDNDAARLADFGLAQLAGGTRLTRTDHIVGTAAYLAPEQVRGDDVTPAADIYALGLVLLECLTGRREYEGAEIESAVARLHRPPVVPEDLPSDLVTTLSLMTSLSATRRPTARHCADALGGLTAALPSDLTTRERPSRGSSHRMPAAVAVAVAAVIATIGTGLVLHDSGPPAESAPVSSTPPPLPATSASTTSSEPASAPAPSTAVQVTVAGQPTPGAPPVQPEEEVQRNKEEPETPKVKPENKTKPDNGKGKGKGNGNGNGNGNGKP